MLALSTLHLSLYAHFNAEIGLPDNNQKIASILGIVWSTRTDFLFNTQKGFWNKNRILLLTNSSPILPMTCFPPNARFPSMVKGVGLKIRCVVLHGFKSHPRNQFNRDDINEMQRLQYDNTQTNRRSGIC